MHYVGLWERAVLQLGFTVYFYNRRLLDRPRYCRYAEPGLMYTSSNWPWQLGFPTHHTCEGRPTPGQPGTAGNPESKLSNKPRLWDPEVKAGQGANCHWSLNSLFIKDSSSLCTPHTLSWKVCSTLKELRETQSPCDHCGFGVELCFLSRSPLLGELDSYRNKFVSNTDIEKRHIHTHKDTQTHGHTGTHGDKDTDIHTNAWIQRHTEWKNTQTHT